MPLHFRGMSRIKISPPNMRSVDLEIRLNSTKKLYPTGIDIEIVFHYRYEVLNDMFASRIVSTDPTLLLWRTKTIQFHHKLCLIIASSDKLRPTIAIFADFGKLEAAPRPGSSLTDWQLAQGHCHRHDGSSHCAAGHSGLLVWLCNGHAAPIGTCAYGNGTRRRRF